MSGRALMSLRDLVSVCIPAGAVLALKNLYAVPIALTYGCITSTDYGAIVSVDNEIFFYSPLSLLLPSLCRCTRGKARYLSIKDYFVYEHLAIDAWLSIIRLSSDMITDTASSLRRFLRAAVTLYYDTSVACSLLSTGSRVANIERRAYNVAECHSASVLITILLRISINVTSDCSSVSCISLLLLFASRELTFNFSPRAMWSNFEWRRDRWLHNAVTKRSWV